MAGPPPFVRCFGAEQPTAKGVCGIYEYHGVLDGRPVYHQTGVSSGNRLWFTEDGEATHCWFVTPRDRPLGGRPEAAVAKCKNSANWPWETSGWLVCGKNHKFVAEPGMQFDLVHPCAELLVHLDAPSLLRGCGVDPASPPKDAAKGATLRLRGGGLVHDRPMYREAAGGALRLFWMPKMARWLLATVKPPAQGGGIEHVLARSLPDDGSTWADTWPWEARSWEIASGPTLGLVDGDAVWQAGVGRLSLDLASPPVRLTGSALEVPESLVGLYEPKGMFNGRVYYVQQLEDVSLESSVGPKALWFAEERGQWVITDPTGIGNSKVVLAKIHSRAWWPWEAHWGGSTAPASASAAPGAARPVWHGGTALPEGVRERWQVAEESGAFRKARDMVVSMICPSELILKAMEGSSHAFLGRYERKGFVSSRPFYQQVVDLAQLEAQAPSPRSSATDADEEEAEDYIKQFVLWYADVWEQWVITEERRFLDCNALFDARVCDTAWFPWQVTAKWELPPAEEEGGWYAEPFLSAEPA